MAKRTNTYRIKVTWQGGDVQAEKHNWTMHIQRQLVEPAIKRWWWKDVPENRFWRSVADHGIVSIDDKWVVNKDFGYSGYEFYFDVFDKSFEEVKALAEELMDRFAKGVEFQTQCGEFTITREIVSE